jgi:hypothetical protein
MIARVKITFDKMYGETPRAFLLLVENRELWFPKRFCRNFTLNKKLGGHTEIPAWLYTEKFNREPNEDDATLIITHHTPEKIKPVDNNTIKELTK